jgi:hypothetical protein
VDSGDRPLRSCSETYYQLGVTSSILSSFFLLLFSYAEDISSWRYIRAYPKVVRLGRCFSPFSLVSSAMFTSFLDGYPYLRCKDDNFFIAVVSIAAIGVLVTTCYGVHLHYHPPVFGDNRVTPFTPPNSSTTEAVSEDDVIRMATSNSKKRIRAKKKEERKMFKEDGDNECSVCMESFDPPKRPAIVTKCGHVYCSKCLSHMHLCASCRSEVKVEDLTLYDESQLVTNSSSLNTLKSSATVSVGGDVENNILGTPAARRELPPIVTCSVNATKTAAEIEMI